MLICTWRGLTLCYATPRTQHSWVHIPLHFSQEGYRPSLGTQPQTRFILLSSWLLLFPKSPIIPKLLFKRADGCLPELLHQTLSQPFVCFSGCMCAHVSSFSAVVVQAIGSKEGVLHIPEHSPLGSLPLKALCTI